MMQEDAHDVIACEIGTFPARSGQYDATQMNKQKFGYKKSKGYT